ncbi:unnamed protein product [Boreogadus saida]
MVTASYLAVAGDLHWRLETAVRNHRLQDTNNMVSHPAGRLNCIHMPGPVGLQQDNTGAPWLMYSCLRTEGTCLALLFYRESSRNRLREFHTKLSVWSAEHSGT